MARKRRSKSRKQHPGQLRVSCLAALGTIPRAKFSDCISVDALNEEHPGRGNSKSKAKLALVAIVECVVGLEYLDLPAARLILVKSRKKLYGHCQIKKLVARLLVLLDPTSHFEL
jgi:hypothetical protein